MNKSEMIHVRIPDDLREWLRAHFPARGDLSWLVRELLEGVREEWGDSKPLSEIITESAKRIA